MKGLPSFFWLIFALRTMTRRQAAQKTTILSMLFGKAVSYVQVLYCKDGDPVPDTDILGALLLDVWKVMEILRHRLITSWLLNRQT